jgi:hypothetical protein
MQQLNGTVAGGDSMKQRTVIAALGAACALPAAGAVFAQQSYGNALNLEMARNCIATAEAEAKKQQLDDGDHGSR